MFKSFLKYANIYLCCGLFVGRLCWWKNFGVFKEEEVPFPDLLESIFNDIRFLSGGMQMQHI